MSTPPRMDAWILAGQSNMQGCGLLCDASLCDAPQSDPRVWSFSSRGQWEIAREPLHRLWESFTPVHQNFMRTGMSETDLAISDEEYAAREEKNGVIGAGLGIPFGAAMADATQKPIALLPAAHGGTSLEQWNPNLKNEGGASLYGAMLERVRRARESADFDLKGILWYQGESDCFDGGAQTYGERFAHWIESARADLNMPELPVIAVQLGRVLGADESAPEQIWNGRHWDSVREALRVLPERVENTSVVSVIDLGLCDNIHIDTPGLIRLGKRMARCALDLNAAPRLKKIMRGENQPNGFGVARVLCDQVSGSWNPKTRIGGFSVCDASGKRHESTLVIEANADARDPKIINVILSATPDDSIRLGYGLGLDPYCNAVDENDMPLPAFSPQAIS